MLEHGGRRTLPGAAAFWILAALFLMLFFGSVPDYLGRLPVIIAALVFSVAGCVVFPAAHGTGALYLARSLPDVATGLASGPAGAALIDLQPAGSQRRPGALASLRPRIAVLVVAATGVLLVRRRAGSGS